MSTVNKTMVQRLIPWIGGTMVFTTLIALVLSGIGTEVLKEAAAVFLSVSMVLLVLLFVAYTLDAYQSAKREKLRPDDEP